MNVKMLNVTVSALYSFSKNQTKMVSMVIDDLMYNRVAHKNKRCLWSSLKYLKLIYKKGVLHIISSLSFVSS